MDYGLGSLPNGEENFQWMKIWFGDLFRRFAFMQPLCFALTITVHLFFIHSRDTMQECLFNLEALLEICRLSGTADVAPPLGHVVPMFRGFYHTYCHQMQRDYL
ncbi:hypothetical protein TNCV_3586341 [Trichonephila clavipes]|nr:hypothetical protein TNCV_3586341 [Trichonephila clavipes]